MMRVSQAEADDLQIGNAINVLDRFMNLLYDGDWWTIDKIANSLNVSRVLVVRVTRLYSWFGAVKYSRALGVVKMSEKLLKLDRSQIPIIPTIMD